MRNHIAVAPFDEPLLGKLGGRKAVITTDGIEETTRAVEMFKSQGLENLHCLQTRFSVPLADVPLAEDWADVPMALHCPSLGRFPELLSRLPLLRRLNARIYLPAAPGGGLTALRILSSLGVEGAVDFNTHPVPWEELADLMTYTLLGLAPHAPIEPFHYIARNYSAKRRTDFGSVYFDDLTRFVHVDPGGRIALSRKDLTEGRFLAGSLEEMEDLEKAPEYAERLERWRKPFLDSEGCAFCRGWRVCLGKFPSARPDGGCSRFFGELMDVVEQHLNLKGKTKNTWPH